MTSVSPMDWQPEPPLHPITPPSTSLKRKFDHQEDAAESFQQARRRLSMCYTGPYTMPGSYSPPVTRPQSPAQSPLQSERPVEDPQNQDREDAAALVHNAIEVTHRALNISYLTMRYYVARVFRCIRWRRTTQPVLRQAIEIGQIVHVDGSPRIEATKRRCQEVGGTQQQEPVTTPTRASASASASRQRQQRAHVNTGSPIRYPRSPYPRTNYPPSPYPVHVQDAEQDTDEEDAIDENTEAEDINTEDNKAEDINTEDNKEEDTKEEEVYSEYLETCRPRVDQTTKIQVIKSMITRGEISRRKQQHKSLLSQHRAGPIRGNRSLYRTNPLKRTIRDRPNPFSLYADPTVRYVQSHEVGAKPEKMETVASMSADENTDQAQHDETPVISGQPHLISTVGAVPGTLHDAVDPEADEQDESPSDRVVDTLVIIDDDEMDESQLAKAAASHTPKTAGIQTPKGAEVHVPKTAEMRRSSGPTTIVVLGELNSQAVNQAQPPPTTPRTLEDELNELLIQPDSEKLTISARAVRAREEKKQLAEQRKKEREAKKLREAQEKAEREAREKQERDAEALAKSKARLARSMPPADKKAIPDLDEEWERKVRAAMEGRNAGHELAWTSTGQAILRRDFGTLLPTIAAIDQTGGWLNDEIINAYLQLVVNEGLKQSKSGLHSERGNKLPPKYHAFNSYFYTNLREKGPASIARWARKAGIGGASLLAAERVFIPVHQGAHWTLLVVSPALRTIEYFDSLGGRSDNFVRNTRAWLAQELGDKYVDAEWTAPVAAGPRQMNGVDCGVFTVTTAKMILRGWDPRAYSQGEIPVQRKRIAAELMNSGFLD